jgi:hypothetical protein
VQLLLQQGGQHLLAVPGQDGLSRRCPLSHTQGALQVREQDWCQVSIGLLPTILCVRVLRGSCSATSSSAKITQAWERQAQELLLQATREHAGSCHGCHGSCVQVCLLLLLLLGTLSLSRCSTLLMCLHGLGHSILQREE